VNSPLKAQQQYAGFLYAAESGFTLLPCLILTMALLMLTLAGLRLTHDFRLLMSGHINRLIAREAAEAVLQDAYSHLKISDDPLSLESSNVVYKYGSMTGDMFSFGGRKQSIESPEYQLDVKRINTHEGIARITATGFGMHTSTRVVILVDYAIRICPDDVLDYCDRQITELAWRELWHD
jgi:Tfp pilus assembly protein PilX